MPIFPEQLWRVSYKETLENKLRCWNGRYCQEKYTALPVDGVAGFIGFGDDFLTVDAGTNKVSFQMKKNSTNDEQQWLWDGEDEGKGWRRIKSKHTNQYLTAELENGWAKLTVKDKGKHCEKFTKGLWGRKVISAIG